MTSKSDSIGVTCTRLRHFADTFSQWNSCWKKSTLGHMTENKCGYQMHIFVTSFSAQHAPAWRCFCMVQPLRQPFRPKCTNRILQMHQQNPVVPPESGVHPQNPVCTYSVMLCVQKSPLLSSRRFVGEVAQISRGDGIVNILRLLAIWLILDVAVCSKTASTLRSELRHAVHSTASWTRSEGLWKGPDFPFPASW